MTSASSLRPKIDPLPLREALSGVAIQGEDSAGEPGASPLVTGVTVDSMDIEPGWIFVAVGGARFHGAKFAEDAVQRGAVAIVTDVAGAEQTPDIPEVPVLVTEDPRASAAVISRNIYWPHFSDLHLVGVTGTNGKTTTTYMVRGALELKFGSVALLGTVEIDVRGPSVEPLISERTTAESPVIYRALALAGQNGYGAAIVEASSHALSLHRIAGLFFDSVVFTNLQHDHLDFYGSMENYYEAKAELFSPKHAKAGVTSIDDEWGRKLAMEAQIPVQTVSALSDESAPEGAQANHWKVRDIRSDASKWGISFDLQDPAGVVHACFCPIPGRVNVQNSALAIMSALQSGVPVEQAIEGLANTVPPPGRMEIVPTVEKQPRVLVDYAHTPEALEAALKTLRPLVPGKLILVFGTDGDRDASKREPLAAIAAQLGDDLWITDENPRTEDPQLVRNDLLRGVSQVRPGMEDVTEVTTSRRDAIRKAILSGKRGDLVVILGKGAEAYQEIDGVRHAHLDSVVAAEVTREVNLF